MPFSLLPKKYYPALTAVSPEALLSRGIRLLMLDFDNTIVPYTTDEPTAEMLQWLTCSQASELTLCVVSNSRNDRVVRFCAEYGIDCITHAAKPFSRGICRCLKKYGLRAAETALVGDQIYTDVLGANCAGVISILIPAINNHNIWLKLRHVLEMPFVLIARRWRV